jgi:CRISPR-associated endonuclease/helicase Cas3
MADVYYAHSLPDKSPSEWQLLENHLRNVAKLARSFGESLGAGEWAYLAGLWHDIGKYSKEFQNMLSLSGDPDAHIETAASRPDHSSAGAQHALNQLKGNGKLLAYAICGHHGGLLDGKSNEACLATRLNKIPPDYSSCPEDILKTPSNLLLPFSLNERKRLWFQISFFVRMVFSCLVDADFLDTERFMDKKKAEWRKGYPSLDTLSRRLTSSLKRLFEKAPDTAINRHRAAILKNCLNAAGHPPGFFSLTVPTGGGKTLSSLSFAFKHALKHGLERIIYVIPYTSIIEQNAAIFRDILGDKAVLEHHSNFEPEEEDNRSRLASENWDAPLVVTTNVQFFESLFARKPSRCRKLHNLVKSVVILDEAQMLPVPLLKPCLEALREIASTYRTTVLLCTATQPALSSTETFRDGLDNVREIVPNPEQLYRAFKRVRTTVLRALPDDELAARISDCYQALCIVNTRKHARLLYERIRENNGVHHISGLMCPAHRTDVIRKIKDSLYNQAPCRVISTQLVEAGVDVDFPIVFRSATGIDSLAQAAGRCNREGKMPGKGEVFYFVPEDGLPTGHFRQTAEIAESVLRHHNDPLSLAAINEYFRLLYWIKDDGLDYYHILNDLDQGAFDGDFPFKEVDRKFKIIRDAMEPLIIPFNREAEKIIRGLRYVDLPGPLIRKAQRFTIQVPPRVLSTLEAAGGVERIHDQYTILTNRGLYQNDLGLCPEDPAFHEVEGLIV